MGRGREIAERLGGVAEESGKIRYLGGRSGIFVAARPFKDIAAFDFFPFQVAGFAGNAEQFVNSGVERLEFVVRHPPIVDGVIFGGEPSRRISRLSAKVVRSNRGESGGRGRSNVRLSRRRPEPGWKAPCWRSGNCTLAGVVAESDRLLGEILHHAHADGVVQFVHGVGVVGGIPWNAALQNHSGRARCGEPSSLAMSRPAQPPPMIHRVYGGESLQRRVPRWGGFSCA